MPLKDKSARRKYQRQWAKAHYGERKEYHRKKSRDFYHAHQTEINKIQRDGQKRRSILAKMKIVQLMGGQCSICGYRRNLAALDFHHKNPNEKEKEIRSLITGKFENVLNEVQKCVLLCKNCHAEIHHPSHSEVEV